MKAVAKPEVRLDDDPRLLDSEAKQRLRVMVLTEKIRGPWACVTYTLRDCGRITREQSDALDRYWQLRKDYVKEMAKDPQTELDLKRCERVKRRYLDACDCLGMAKKWVDEAVFEEIWPVGERGHLALKQGAEMLRIFFSTGTKRQRVRGGG